MFFFIFYVWFFFSWDFYFSTFSESERINAFNMRNGIDPKKEEDQVIDQSEFILDGWKNNMIELEMSHQILTRKTYSYHLKWNSSKISIILNISTQHYRYMNLMTQVYLDNSRFQKTKMELKIISDNDFGTSDWKKGVARETDSFIISRRLFSDGFPR